jgi:acetyl esterase/lipase
LTGRDAAARRPAITPPARLAALRAHLAGVTARWAGGMTLAEIRDSYRNFLDAAGPHGLTLAEPRRFAIEAIPAAWIGNGPIRALYCHGGGFQIGSIASHHSLMARIAAGAGASLLAFDYRLAPEHRYPAARDDAIAVYRWLLQNGGAPQAIIGDSAGAALALQVAMRAREAGWPLPGALVLLSPWLDLALRGDSYRTLAERDMFSRPAQLQAMARTYLGRGHDPAAPTVSPLYGDLSRLPPMLVHAGGDDITLDDSRLLDERVRAAGGRITLHVFPAMCHHFQVFEDLPESAASLAGIGAFLASAGQTV